MENGDGGITPTLAVIVTIGTTSDLMTRVRSDLVKNNVRLVWQSEGCLPAQKRK